MIKIWFLMALMSYPNIPAIAYKGFGGFLTPEESKVFALNEQKYLIKDNIYDYKYTSWFLAGKAKA